MKYSHIIDEKGFVRCCNHFCDADGLTKKQFNDKYNNDKYVGLIKIKWKKKIK